MASIDKAQVKIGTAAAIGSGLDDMLEGAERTEYRAEGGFLALRNAEKAVSALHVNLKADFEEGKVDEPTMQVVRRWIARAEAVVENLKLVERNNRLAAAGSVSTLKKAIEIPKKICDEEEMKIRREVAVAAEAAEAEVKAAEEASAAALKEPETPKLVKPATKYPKPKTPRRAKKAKK